MTRSMPAPQELALAARLYYVDGLAQAEIAKLLSASQAKVSRMLRLAREEGIVRITVEDYPARAPDLEEDLSSRLGLRQVAVFRPPARAESAAARRCVGYFGAPVAAQLIRAAQTVGLTGGRTINELVSYLGEEPEKRPLRVVQLMGNISIEVADFDAIELSRRLASAFGGSFFTLNSPALIAQPRSRAAILEHEQVRQVWELFSAMDLAFVGIGSLSDSAFIARQVLAPADLERLRRAGAVGEICGRFYDAGGEECDSEYRERVVSIGFEELRRVPLVVAVTAGADRAEALHTALSAGLVTGMLIDEECARAVLERAGGAG